MSNRETSGDTTKDCEQTAKYSLGLELSSGLDSTVSLVNVTKHSLQSGFMVVQYAGGEQWFRAGDITRLTKSYM